MSTRSTTSLSVSSTCLTSTEVKNTWAEYKKNIKFLEASAEQLKERIQIKDDRIISLETEKKDLEDLNEFLLNRVVELEKAMEVTKAKETDIYTYFPSYFLETETTDEVDRHVSISNKSDFTFHVQCPTLRFKKDVAVPPKQTVKVKISKKRMSCAREEGLLRLEIKGKDFYEDIELLIKKREEMIRVTPISYKNRPVEVRIDHGMEELYLSPKKKIQLLNYVQPPPGGYFIANSTKSLQFLVPEEYKGPIFSLNSPKQGKKWKYHYKIENPN